MRYFIEDLYGREFEVSEKEFKKEKLFWNMINYSLLFGALSGLIFSVLVMIYG